MMSIIKMRGPIDVLFAFKIFSLPVPTRPGTRTFWQVPDPSRPEVKNPYPSDPVLDIYARQNSKICHAGLIILAAAQQNLFKRIRGSCKIRKTSEQLGYKTPQSTSVI